MFLDGVDFVEAVKQLTGTTSLSEQRSPAAEAAAKAQVERARRGEGEAEQHAKARSLWSQIARRRTALSSTTGARVSRRSRQQLGSSPHRRLSAGDDAAYAMPNEVEPGVLGPPLKVEAVHLTRLLPDGSDRVSRITVGRPLGLPIVMSSIPDGLSLVVCEGIEDALAYAADGFAAWAASSSACFPAIATSIPTMTSVTVEMHPMPSRRRSGLWSCCANARCARASACRRPSCGGSRMTSSAIRPTS
jgi:hypothetical protein